MIVNLDAEERFLSLARYEHLAERNRLAAELGHITCSNGDIESACEVNKLLSFKGGIKEHSGYMTILDSFEVIIRAFKAMDKGVLLKEVRLEQARGFAAQIRTDCQENISAQVVRTNMRLSKLGNRAWLGFGVRSTDRLAGQEPFRLAIIREIDGSNATKDEPVATATVEDMHGELHRLPPSFRNFGVYLKLE